MIILTADSLHNLSNRNALNSVKSQTVFSKASEFEIPNKYFSGKLMFSSDIRCPFPSFCFLIVWYELPDILLLVQTQCLRYKKYSHIVLVSFKYRLELENNPRRRARRFVGFVIYSFFFFFTLTINSLYVLFEFF